MPEDILVSDKALNLRDKDEHFWAALQYCYDVINNAIGSAPSHQETVLNNTFNLAE